MSRLELARAAGLALAEAEPESTDHPMPRPPRLFGQSEAECAGCPLPRDHQRLVPPYCQKGPALVWKRMRIPTAIGKVTMFCMAKGKLVQNNWCHPHVAGPALMAVLITESDDILLLLKRRSGPYGESDEIPCCGLFWAPLERHPVPGLVPMAVCLALATTGRSCWPSASFDRIARAGGRGAARPQTRPPFSLGAILARPESDSHALHRAE